MKSRWFMALVCAAVASCVSASASTLGGLAVTPLASGAATPGSCDNDGLGTTYTTEGGRITHVAVSGIADPGCEGASLSLTLVTNGNASVGSGGPVTVPVDAGTVDDSVVVPVSARPNARAITGIHVVMEG